MERQGRDFVPGNRVSNFRYYSGRSCLLTQPPALAGMEQNHMLHGGVWLESLGPGFSSFPALCLLEKRQQSVRGGVAAWGIADRRWSFQ